MKPLFTFLLALILSIPLMANEIFDDANLATSSFTEEFKVYPNPSSTGKFTLEFSTKNFEEEVTIKVFNLIGKEVYRHKVSSHIGDYRQTISINSLPKGMYLLEISNGEHKQVRRVYYT